MVDSALIMFSAKKSYGLINAQISINAGGIAQPSVEPIPPDGGAAFFSATQNMCPDHETVQFCINT